MTFTTGNETLAFQESQPQLDVLYHVNSRSLSWNLDNWLDITYRDFPKDSPYSRIVGSVIGREPTSQRVNLAHEHLVDLLARTSTRSLAPDHLPRDLWAELCALSYGVHGNGDAWYCRAVPSGGGLYPLELFVLAKDSTGEWFLDSFDPYHNCLRAFRPHVSEEEAVEICMDPRTMRNAAGIVIIAGNLDRCKVKYGFRAYRFSLMEAGSVLQSMGLATSYLGLAGYASSQFYDDRLESLCQLDGIHRMAFTVQIVGKPKG